MNLLEIILLVPLAGGILLALSVTGHPAAG